MTDYIVRTKQCDMLEKIPVSKRNQSMPYMDAYQAYNNLSGALGANSLYLLESIAGPNADCQAAIIGIDPLILIQIHEKSVAFEGNPILIEHLTRRTVSEGTLEESGGSYALREFAQLWDFLRGVSNSFDRDWDDCRSGFQFGFFGYFGYDTVRAVEDLPRLLDDETDEPIICLALHRCTLQFDLGAKEAMLTIATAPAWLADESRIVQQVEECLCITGPSMEKESVPEVPTPLHVSDSINRDTYREGVEKCLHYISIGDIYQVQLGHQLSIQSEADPGTVYQRLRARNPSPYMYLCRLGDVTVIGASPELFIRIKDGQIVMRPIAGTAGRTDDDQENNRIAKQLAEDEKECAEHIMLVDLCRNDVGRVCKPDTLEVDEMMCCEHYSHVMHLVSNVIGQQQDGVDAYDVIAACFPAGTMTGAPKIRAMEIIKELETSTRGIYAGLIGLIDFGGYVSTALCIRTAVHREQTYKIRASAGVVADSIAEKEWRETMHKLSACYWAITGAEVADDYTGN